MQNAQAGYEENEAPSNIEEFLQEDFAKRLGIVIGNESYYSFAKRSGVGESLLRSYLKGTTPRLDKVIAIARAAGVSLEWLATGEGPMSRASLGKTLIDEAKSEAYDDPEYRWLGSDAITKAFIQVKQTLLEENPSLSHKGIGIRQMRDSSMSPTLQPGDWFVLDPTETDLSRIDHGIYTCHVSGKELTRFLSRVPGNNLKVTSNQSEQDSFHIDLATPPPDFSIKGRVVGVIRFEVPPFKYV